MFDYQLRVVAEREELVEKIGRLSAFVNSDAFGAVDANEQDRLQRQLLCMTEYADILTERVSNFTE